MSKYSLIIIFLILLHNNSKSQSKDNLIKSDTAKKEWVINGFINDQAKLWTSSVHYNKKNLFIVVPVIAATTVAIIYDEKVNTEVLKFTERNTAIKNAGSFITNGGNTFVALGACGMLYFGGMTFGDNKLEQTGFLAAYALANTGVITTVFKVITGRQRPYKDNGKDTWHWLSDYFHSPNTIGDDNHSSFPSGHSAVAWSLASVISTEYNDTKFVAPVAYTLATAVSLSRLTENDHWLSDVIVGSAIGYGVGIYVVNHHRHSKWTLLPVYSQNNLMFTCVYRF